MHVQFSMSAWNEGNHFNLNMTGAPPVPPRRSIHNVSGSRDEKIVQMVPIDREDLPPPVPHRGNYSAYPQVAHAEQENMPPYHNAAVFMNDRKVQMVAPQREEIPPPVPHRGNVYPQAAHTEQMTRPPIHPHLMHEEKTPIVPDKRAKLPPVPQRGNHNSYPQGAYTEQETKPHVPPNAGHDVPPVPPPHNSALHMHNGHPVPYPVHYFPYPAHMVPWYGAPHQHVYDMSHLPMAPSGYPKYLELGSTPPPVPYGAHMAAYYTPQNSAMQSEATTSGESHGSIYNPHTDSMVPGYENLTPYRPLDFGERTKEEVDSSGDEASSPTPSSSNKNYTKRSAYSCAQCRKRKTILGEDRGGKLICRKCCEADTNYVGAVKRNSVTPRSSESGKSFVCTICHNNRERRHFYNGDLVCRACYYAKTKDQDTKSSKGAERVCDNCNIKQQPDIKVYNRSKFNEVLCHNCFHYKLRNGVSRPLEFASSIPSKL